MKILLSFCLALTLLAVANAQISWTGKTEAEVIAAKGKPVAKTVAGTRAIYRWNDMVLTFENGKVSKVEIRDLKKEQATSKTEAANALRRRLAADAKKKEDKEINDAREAELAREQVAATTDAAEQERLKNVAKIKEAQSEQAKWSKLNQDQSYTQSHSDAERRDKANGQH